jgi:hypothetical protein
VIWTILTFNMIILNVHKGVLQKKGALGATYMPDGVSMSVIMDYILAVSIIGRFQDVEWLIII